MRSRAIDPSKRHKPYVSGKKLAMLTIAGGAAFWLTSLAISLLPIAAKYRAAFSNWSIEAVWMGSLIAGLTIGCSVSYFLVRFFPKIPAKSPVIKSMILSSIALVVAIILIDVPMIMHAPSNALYYFFIGVGFNAARYLFLGIAVGYLYEKLHG